MRRKAASPGTLMSASFGKRLKRELTGNPKKAGALGVLFVVAIWFWFPLVKGWISPEVKAPPAKPGSAASSAAPVAANQGPAGAPTNVAANLPPSLPAGAPSASPDGTAPQTPAFAGGHTWQQVSTAIANDTRMRPVTVATDRSNIFPAEPSAEAVAAAAAAERTAEQPLLKLSPSEAGLVLSSTIVGPKRRTALVNGRRYSVGDEIKSKKEGQQIVFKLLAVEPKQIVLENSGDRFLMKMPGARLAGDDDVQ
jgi:hypothetical protein